LEALAAPHAPEQLADLPAIQVLGKVGARHFEPRSEGGSGSAGERCARLCPIRGLGRNEDRIESPSDGEARFRTKREMSWTGYRVHLTETCDPNAPRLVIPIDTTSASVHEARRTGPLHAALARKGLTPRAHLVDAAYVSARQLVEARERYGIDLVGPTPQDVSWQHRREGAFGIDAFTVDWESQRVRCPEGQHSMSWSEYQDKARGHRIKVHFSSTACQACPSKPLCTRTKTQGRPLSLHPREAHEALAAARARQAREEERPLYQLRAGIEGPLSQGVRAFGLRQARYRGLAKMHPQNVATAVALNVDRLAAWLEDRPLAPTRKSRFTALAA
jgi:hypothetical protein